MCLEPPRGQPRSAAVARARERFETVEENNWQVLGPRIAAHLDGYMAAVGEIAQAHHWIADHTELDLTADTRPTALWLVSGRCIGQANASLGLLRAGYVLQVPPLLRCMQEGLTLLSALQHDDKVLKKWNRDRNSVDMKQALASVDRWQEQMREDMLKAGVRPTGRTKSFFKQGYGRLSEFTHYRRRHIVDEVAKDARLMPLGSHPSAQIHAARVWETGWTIIQMVSVVGHALSFSTLGRAWFDRFQGTFRSLLQLHSKIPIDPETLTGGDRVVDQSPIRSRTAGDRI